MAERRFPAETLIGPATRRSAALRAPMPQQQRIERDARALQG